MQDDYKWYLAYTKPRHEDSVSARLAMAGMEVMNPRINERKLYRRKVTEVVSPLFPCYVFVRFRASGYHLVRYTRGIKTVIGNESGPIAVPGHVIDSIRERSQGGTIVIRPSFSPGESVVIKTGPFEGLSAIFEREMRGIERVSVLLREMNVRVVVDGSLLARC